MDPFLAADTAQEATDLLVRARHAVVGEGTAEHPQPREVQESGDTVSSTDYYERSDWSQNEQG